MQTERNPALVGVRCPLRNAMVGSAQYVVGVDAKNLQVVRDQLCVQCHIHREGFIPANCYVVY